MKSKAFKIAHQVKQFFSNFSQALKAGWILAKLNLGYSVSFEFVKSTGEVRSTKAIACTLGELDKGLVRFVESVGTDRTRWRSFRLDRLIV